MKIEAKTPDEYLSKLPEDRREALSKVREVVLANILDGYEETMTYNMISYSIPFNVYPDTYNNQPLTLLSIGNQKNHMALYINNIYSDPDLKQWFVNEYEETGKKLDMGKSCVRFKNLENLPLELIGETVAKTTVDGFIAMYERSRKLKD